jgi:hypothetical protein
MAAEPRAQRPTHALSAVVTTPWPRVRRCFGAAGAVEAEVRARRGLQGKRHGEEGQPLDMEVGGGAHPNSGSMCGVGGGSVRRGPRWSRGWRRLRLALKATGEGERGEGGPN